MGSSHRRRGDSIRAALHLLTESTDAQLCQVVAEAVGVTYVELYLLLSYNTARATLTRLATTEHTTSSPPAPYEVSISLDLLARTLIRGGMLAADDLLIVALRPPAHKALPETGAALRFLVVHADEDLSRRPSFSEADRRRVQLLASMASLQAQASTAQISTTLLAQVTPVLAAEPTIDRKLLHLASALSDGAETVYALIWCRSITDGSKLLLRAAHGVGEEMELTALRERSRAFTALQESLLTQAEYTLPHVVPLDRVAWLPGLLACESATIGSQILVLPLRRGSEIVGVALCAQPRAQAGAQLAALCLDRRPLFTILASQIIVTADYLHSTLSAHQTAERFALLASISEIALSKMGMDEMLDAIIMQVHTYFKSASINLYLQGSERLSARTRSLHRVTLAPDERCDARVLLTSHGQTLGAMLIRREASNPFSDEDHETLMQAAEQIALAVATSGRYETQASLAVIDPLTGLPNRRSADEALDRMLQRAQREAAAISVALLDIDHFKMINDTYGHDYGDEVLREVGLIFRSYVRSTDMIARYGGEEFLIILATDGNETARHICERLRHSISEIEIATSSGEPITISASLGGATYPDHGLTRDELYQRADAALYRAKHLGRNRLVWCTDEPLKQQKASS